MFENNKALHLHGVLEYREHFTDWINSASIFYECLEAQRN